MKIVTHIKVYEIDGMNVDKLDSEMTIATHPHDETCTIISVCGKTYTVDTEELEKAVENANNV